MQELEDDWGKSEDGYIVIDSTGVILWNNAPVCRYFGYGCKELLNENVRVLMPEPYAQEHDQFLRRYSQTGIKNIIGTERTVPVVKKDGTRSTVTLAVKSRISPFGDRTQLFIGHMRFGQLDPAMVALSKVWDALGLYEEAWGAAGRASGGFG